ncbi:hypothetical protein Q8W40_24560 [Vibrio penaeicida]|uniref:hypothetical protein n=1 Tax=Vibrio penaeicida TaxID=104609 RepID=UPI002734924D|nr:hypothetical protein [Vibrio penaeicida]MDP2575391.1 hypothetical protein [Vibrio penaeicida]
MTIFDPPLDGFDILALVLVANMLTLWAIYGFWRLNKKDDWDWHSILAIGVPAVIGMVAVYLGSHAV